MILIIRITRRLLEAIGVKIWDKFVASAMQVTVPKES